MAEAQFLFCRPFPADSDSLRSQLEQGGWAGHRAASPSPLHTVPFASAGLLALWEPS